MLVAATKKQTKAERLENTLCSIMSIDDVEEQSKRLKRLLYTDDGHSDIHKGNLSDTDVLQRMLDERKTINSQFTSEKHMNDAICNLMIYKSEYITDNMGFYHNGKTLAIHEPNFGSCDDNPLGTGFVNINGFYHKFKTDSVVLVLKKDISFNDNNFLDFHIQTVYPGCDSRDPKQINKSLTISNEPITDIMKSTPYYKQAGVTEKACLLYKSDCKNKIPAKFVDGSHNGYDDAIFLTKDNNDGTVYTARIKADGECSITMKDKKTHQKLPFDAAKTCSKRGDVLYLSNDEMKQQFAQTEPDLIKSIDTVFDYIDEVQTPKSKSKENTINKSKQNLTLNSIIAGLDDTQIEHDSNDDLFEITL